jgi:hypothetical protein
MKRWVFASCLLICALKLNAQDADTTSTHAGYVPVISGGLGYIYNVNNGTPTLLPQINPLLLLPLGSHVLVESRTDFTGFFQRRDGTSGDYTGPIFKTVEFAQVDWLANSHIIPVAGRYILPFGLYSERLGPLWIANFQDSPVDYAIGTRTSGSGDGGMLRGVLAQNNSLSVQYSTYFSAHDGTNQLQAARTAGADGSVYFTNQRVEVGGSYQRFLESRRINNAATYVSWQPQKAPLDLKAEYDYNFYGNGYWIESAYRLSQVPVANQFFKTLDFVARVQQFHPLNGGGNGVPTLNTQRVDVGLNYYFRDNNWRVITNYGRTFNANQDRNIWNVGFTYRFLWPLWPGRK